MKRLTIRHTVSTCLLYLIRKLKSLVKDFERKLSSTGVVKLWIDRALFRVLVGPVRINRIIVVAVVVVECLNAMLDVHQ